MSDAAKTSGWGFPGNSRKAHYFEDGRSLCNKWMFFGDVEPDNGRASPDDCAACRKAFQRIPKKQVGESE